MALSFLMASTFSHASLALPLKTLHVPCFKEKQNALIYSQPHDTTIHSLSSSIHRSLWFLQEIPLVVRLSVNPMVGGFMLPWNERLSCQLPNSVGAI